MPPLLARRPVSAIGSPLLLSLREQGQYLSVSTQPASSPRLACVALRANRLFVVLPCLYSISSFVLDAQVRNMGIDVLLQVAVAAELEQ